MPRKGSGPRLVLYGPTHVKGWPCKVKARVKNHIFYIVDKSAGIERSTSFGLDRVADAQKALSAYLESQLAPTAEVDPPITEVLKAYRARK